MKWEFQLALQRRMVTDPRIHLLMGDVGGVMFKEARASFPYRILNVGICEQATVSMAAGMAIEGLRPIIYTITPFLIERAFEQVKLDVHEMNLPVGLVGHSDNSCGPTHIERSAPALLALLPRIAAYFPRTPAEVTAIMEKVDLDHPWFLKLGETPKGNPLLRPGSGLLWTCPSPSRGPSRRSPSAGGRNEDAMSPPPIHRENQ